jgi:hypothetical protein
LFGQQWSQPYFASEGADIGYANRITPTLSVGMLTRIRYSSIAGSSLWSASAAIGLQYYPSPGISYGLVFKDIGSGVVYSYEGAKSLLSYEMNLPRSLTIGSTFHFPSMAEHPYVSLSMDCELLLGPSQFINKGGIEIEPWRFLALRIGGLTSNAGNILRFGIGLLFSSIQVDYAVSPSLTSERFHQISVSVPFQRSQE